MTRCDGIDARVGRAFATTRQRTRAAAELERYLEGTALPVVAHLRDTQMYVQAAAHAMSIFDLPPSRAAQEVEQWQPLLDWAGMRPGSDA